jgi:hypothetical protein
VATPRARAIRHRGIPGFPDQPRGARR